MCRIIKQLHQPAGLATEEEIKATALQFVRKVSGYRKPSRTNQYAFDMAVDQIALATQELFATIQKSDG